MTLLLSWLITVCMPIYLDYLCMLQLCAASDADVRLRGSTVTTSVGTVQTRAGATCDHKAVDFSFADTVPHQTCCDQRRYGFTITMQTREFAASKQAAFCRQTMSQINTAHNTLNRKSAAGNHRSLRGRGCHSP